MPTALPRLTTSRLLLRTLEIDQVEVLFSLANGPNIVENAANIPSPYILKTGQTFIARIAEKYLAGEPGDACA